MNYGTAEAVPFRATRSCDSFLNGAYQYPGANLSTIPRFPLLPVFNHSICHIPGGIYCKHGTYPSTLPPFITFG
jgi:hypothetical protein